MELKVNGKDLQLKFNFASLALWEDKILDEDGKKQTDDTMFDTLFTGLAQYSPKTLVDIANGGLAYLHNDKPNYADVFDAVSDLMEHESPKELAKSLMAELTANGFFKASMTQWKGSIVKNYHNLQEAMKDDKKPAKNASQDKKDAYAQRQMIGNNTLDQFKPLLDNLENLEKATGVTL